MAAFLRYPWPGGARQVRTLRQRVLSTLSGLSRASTFRLLIETPYIYKQSPNLEQT
jgi:hypothetical protein